MRRSVLPVALGVSLALAAQAQDLRNTAAARAACGPPETTFNVEALRPAASAHNDPGKALIYLIEQESSTPALCLGRCGGLTLKLGLDGHWIGAVSGSSYAVFAVEAGEHHLCASWQSHVKKLSEKIALQDLTAGAGKTYYFVTRYLATPPEAGSMASITLEPLNPDEAKMLIEAYPQVKATPKK